MQWRGKMLQSRTGNMTIWRKRNACWIPKATNKHSEYIILIGFPQQQWLHKRAPALSFTCIVCLVLIQKR